MNIPYRLPDGRVIQIDGAMAQDYEVIAYPLADGRMVSAIRVHYCPDCGYEHLTRPPALICPACGTKFGLDHADPAAPTPEAVCIKDDTGRGTGRHVMNIPYRLPDGRVIVVDVTANHAIIYHLMPDGQIVKAIRVEAAWPHTPGPWTTDGKADELHIARVRFSSCTCCYRWITAPHRTNEDGMTLGEAAANACLIEASPDLYAALDELTAIVAEFVATCGVPDGYEPLERLMVKANDALEKARYVPVPGKAVAERIR